MMAQLFKLIFLCDDVTGSGMICGKGAAYDLPTAMRLVATGVCRIADDEPEREELQAAVRAYKRATPSGQRWEIALVQPRYFR